MHALNDKDEIQEGFCTLELGWKDNKRNISCIPKGEYTVVKRYSRKFKHHFHVTGVEGRSYILIHKGNYYTDIRGCILVGTDFKNINGDHLLDVINSNTAMDKLLELMPDKFKLTIIGG